MEIGYLVLGYLSGSIPFGWILAKLKDNKDLRKIGSGATGATNTFRASGLIIGLITAVLDVLKAFLPTLLVIQTQPNETVLQCLVAASTILGHTKSIFLRLRGGKAVSPAAGALFAFSTVNPELLLILVPAVPAMIGAIAVTRGIVSVGSLLGSSTAALATILLTLQGNVVTAYCLWIIAATVYIWLMHKPNIERLLKGKENRITFGGSH